MSIEKPLLMIAAILSGVAAGLIGYFIGEHVYVLFIFPFILLLIGTVLYLFFLRFFGATRALGRAWGGLIMGLTILLTFHYVEYSVFRSNVIAKIEAAHPASRTSAPLSIDAFLRDRTGLGGFVGFLKYQQSQFRPFSWSLTRDNKIIRTFALYLRRKTAWPYLMGEASVLLGGGFVAGLVSKRCLRWNAQQDEESRLV